MKYAALFITFMVLLGSAIVVAAENNRGYTWNYIMSDVGDIPDYPHIGVGSDGRIWVAYTSHFVDNGYINVTWYDGSWHNDVILHGTWNVVGKAVASSPISLSMEGSVPHIFYYEYTNNGLDGYLYNSYYAGNTWHTETIWHGSLINNTGKPSNTVESKFYNGEFYVLFQVYGIDSTTSPKNGLYLAIGNTGSWNVREVMIGDSSYQYFGDIYVYNSTLVGICVYEYNTNSGTYTIKYLEYNGISFTQPEQIATETDDYVPSVVIDNNAIPHIFYSKTVGPNGETYLAELTKLNNNWTLSYVDSSVNNPGGPLDAMERSNGNIAIAYNIDGQNGIQFAENSTTWNYDELSDPLSGNALRGYVTVTEDSAGNMFVAYTNWNSEKVDNYYVVVATTKSDVPELYPFVQVIFIAVLMAEVIYTSRVMRIR